MITFGALYETSGTTVYSTYDKNKKIFANTHRCIKYFEKVFPGKKIVLRKYCLRNVIKAPTTYVVQFEEKWREEWSSTTR